MPKRPTPKPSSTTKKTAALSLHENVTTALRTLGVALAPGALDTVLSAAEKESLSHLEFLHRLLAGPAEAKLQRALQRRIGEAKFRELTSLEGQTGLGKSRILQSVGHAACVQGYHVRYATSAKLLQEFTAALADGTYERMLAGYARRDLLIIDEFGFDRLEREAHTQASTFYYRLLDARMGRRSTALATNIDFNVWDNYLGDPPLAAAFLDRLVDGAVVLKLTGRSYRAHRARPATVPGGVDPS